MSGDAPNAVGVRLACLQIAGQALGELTATESQMIVDFAKKLETYAWGLLGPIERGPNPLTTIEEAANATRDRLEELLANMPENDEKVKLRTARGAWERFVSELEQALGKRFS